MGVSHISDVESIILYLYFQIILIKRCLWKVSILYCGPEIDVSVWKKNKQIKTKLSILFFAFFILYDIQW